MSGRLVHSPADIVRWLIVQGGQGADPTVVDSNGLPTGVWPVYESREPDVPDGVVTVYNTQGRDGGRTMVDGERQEHHGILLRIRSGTPVQGFLKARALAVWLDQNVVFVSVAFGGSTYIVKEFSRTGEVIPLGKETPSSQRNIFTVNGVVCLRQTA